MVGVEDHDELARRAGNSGVDVAGLGMVPALAAQVAHTLGFAPGFQLVAAAVVENPGVVRNPHVASSPHGAEDDVDRLAADGDEDVDARRLQPGHESLPVRVHLGRVRAVVVGQDGPPGAERLEHRETLGDEKNGPQSGVAAVGRVEEEQDVEDGQHQGAGHGDPGAALHRLPGQFVRGARGQVIVTSSVGGASGRGHSEIGR